MDRVYPPPMFGGTVALCSNDGNGTYVLYSNDLWKSAKYLGLAKSPESDGITTATAQISNSLYTNTEFFFDTGAFDRQPGGNRSVFTFTDITKEVVGLVTSANITTKARRA